MYFNILRFSSKGSVCALYVLIERERERGGGERERIFIQINRNNDTIIIQCMDYTDWYKETCIKTLKIARMQATLMLIL